MAITTALPGSDTPARTRVGDRVMTGITSGSGIAIIALVVAVGLFLLTTAVPSVIKDQVPFLFSREWNVADSTNLRFGIVDLLWTTVLSSAVAMAIAVPVAIGIALFITQYAPRRVARPAAFVIDLLAAVPSIIYGLWGLIILAPVIKPLANALNSALGWIPLFGHGIDSAGTVFTASIVLAIMVLPIVTAISRDVFDQTPLLHKEAALALGATKWEMIRTAVLPFGRPGAISASMLGLGRALGETIAVSIILSKPPTGVSFNPSLFYGGETFASKIANNAAEFDSPTKTGAYVAAGLVLFLLTLAVNALARVIINRRREFSE